jgi:hypothetical protein
LAYRKVETTHEYFADDKNKRGETYVKSRGLKLKFIERSHYKEKMLCGLQFTRKALIISNIGSNFMILSVFETFAGRTNASGGPHAARVFETLGKELSQILLIGIVSIFVCFQ